MKTFVLLLVTICTATLAARADDFAGGFLLNDRWAAVTLSTADRRVAIEVPAAGTYSGTYPAAGDRIDFTVAVGTDDVRLRARPTSPDTLEGTATFRKHEYRFGATRLGAVERRLTIYGVYRSSDGHALGISEWFGDRNAVLTDYETGEVRVIWPAADGTWFGGDLRYVNFPVTLRVTFDGGTMTVRRRGNVTTARRVPIIARKLEFATRGIKLRGTLLVPEGSGTFGAIVVAPGAFRSPRDVARLFAHAFVARGIAAFIYDAPGSGESEGEVGGAIPELAGDLLAAVRVVAWQREIRSAEVGVFAFSNSAWNAIEVASRQPRAIAYLIMQSFSAVPPWQSETFRAEEQLRADGFSEEIARAGAEFMKRKFDVARTGEGWEELNRIATDPKNAAWISYTNPPSSLARLRKTWQDQFSYDPLPAIKKLRVPAYFFYGGLDTNVPAKASIEVLKANLPNLAQDRIEFFPTGRHDLVEGIAGGSRHGGIAARYAPNYWAWMTDYAWQRLDPPALGQQYRAEIEAANRLMEEAGVRNPSAVPELYTDDASMRAPGTLAHGREAINAYWAAVKQIRNWKLEVLDVQGGPDVILERGRSMVDLGDRDSVVDFVLVYKRQPDGTLKVYLDFYH